MNMPGAKSPWPLLHYRLDDFTEPWMQAPVPTVLLHPGLAGNGELYRSWVPHLCTRYRILRIDARGQGRSPRPYGYEWSLDAFVDDALAVMDHLEIDRVHWVGASGGGIIGQHAAVKAEGRIESLTLLATTARFRAPTSRVDDWLAPLDRGDAKEFFVQDIERRFGTDHPERTRWIIDEILRTSVQIIAELHRWVIGVDLIEELARITCPVMIITGEQDTLTDLSDARLMQQRIPNARLHVIEGHPHNVGYTHPQIVASIVRHFLDETAGFADHRIDEARAMTEMLGRVLPEDRLKQLGTTFAAYLTNLERVREIRTGDAEPATMTFDSEAPS